MDLDALTAANLRDLFRAFRVGAAFHPLATPVLYPFARRFASELGRCDRRVREVGLQGAMHETLGRLGVRLETFGAGQLPAVGPLLVTANHPGLSDAPALIASLGRPDLRIVSAERDLLAALPELYARLIVVDAGRPQRSVGQVARHLRAGGAVLTFPAGRIEPDPALKPRAAAASLGSWSRSAQLFARLEPRTRVVPAVVAGVVTPETLRHPLTRLHRDPEDKAWLAACLQVMRRHYRHSHVSVRYGAPLSYTPEGSADAFFATVLGRTAALIGASPSPGATQQNRNALQ